MPVATCAVPLLSAALLMLTAPAWGQGNESTTTAAQSEGQQQGDTVAIGAGSTAAVTTGSSGPGSAQNTAVMPLSPAFAIAPRASDGADLPMLPVRAPRRLRCEIIGDVAARARCETRDSQ